MELCEVIRSQNFSWRSAATQPHRQQGFKPGFLGSNTSVNPVEKNVGARFWFSNLC